MRSEKAPERFPLMVRPDLNDPSLQRGGLLTLFTHQSRGDAADPEMHIFMLRPDTIEEIRQPSRFERIIRMSGTLMTGEQVRCTLHYNNAQATQFVEFEVQNDSNEAPQV